jgi:hypothetical protein
VLVQLVDSQQPVAPRVDGVEERVHVHQIDVAWTLGEEEVFFVLFSCRCGSVFCLVVCLSGRGSAVLVFAGAALFCLVCCLLSGVI